MQDQAEDYTGVVTAAMLWDMLPAEAVVPLCAEIDGITPPGPDGAAFELAASDARRAAIGPLLPWIEVLSVIAAEIEGIATIRPVSVTRDDSTVTVTPTAAPTAEQLRQLRQERDQFEMDAHDIIVPAACAIVSLLVDRGFLKVTDRGQAATLDAFTGS